MHKGMAFGVKLDYIFYAQGILSASVLSIIPLIRPYRWQSLLMPVWFHFNLLVFFFLSIPWTSDFIYEFTGFA